MTIRSLVKAKCLCKSGHEAAVDHYEQQTLECPAREEDQFYDCSVNILSLPLVKVYPDVVFAAMLETD